jgi:hypothetical protein
MHVGLLLAFVFVLFLRNVYPIFYIPTFLLMPRGGSEQRSVRASQFENPRYRKLSQLMETPHISMDGADLP